MNLLCSTAEEASKTVCPSVEHKDDAMNINKYIKIIKVFDTSEFCKFYKAGILEKKFAYRRIEKTIENCRVLLIKGSAWFYLDHKKILSITDIINQETSYLTNLYNIILQINPNVIILEKSMPQKLIKKLEKIGIGVIMNVPLKKLMHISRICQGKIISSLGQIEDMNEAVGTCKSYFQITLKTQKFAVFHDENNCIFAGSIMLSACSTNILSSLSKILKQIILLYRITLIERNLF